MWKYVLAIILGYFVLTKVVLQDAGEDNLENQVVNTDISIAQEVASTGVSTEVNTSEAVSAASKAVNVPVAENIITEPKILDNVEEIIKPRIVKVPVISEPTFRIADAAEGADDPTMDFSSGGDAGGMDVFAKLELALAGAEEQEVESVIDSVVSSTMSSMKKTGEVKLLIAQAKNKGLKTTSGDIKKILKDTLVTQVRAKKEGVKATSSTDKYGNFLYTVKSGDTLWKIAKDYYASPFDFIKIYIANKDQITDPNLIEVGQVFKLPGIKR